MANNKEIEEDEKKNAKQKTKHLPQKQQHIYVNKFALCDCECGATENAEKPTIPHESEAKRLNQANERASKRASELAHKLNEKLKRFIHIFIILYVCICV